ncbi:cache domain-containing protein [Sulfurospirillum arcachonense]|uniref:cache domain-containing protein n=1 Tax=Sulfurospirillum arcachonense TaxID=57666 RepID=UPI00046A2B27|nr:cache domain-containing protein [Sulfurospirillum arcachonense]
MNKKVNLLKYLSVSTAGLLVLFCVVFMLVNIATNYNKFQKKSEILKQEYMQSKKDNLKSGVEHFIELIKYNKKKIEKQKKEFLKKRVLIAYKIAEQLYNQYKNTKPLEEIKQITIEALRTIRYENNESYFIADLDGYIRLSGDRPKYEGTNVLEFQNSKGVFVTKEAISLVKNKSEGYYTYLWGSRKNQEQNKITYIKLFKQFGWIIGVGVYENNIKKEIQKYILSNIKQMEFNYDHRNYIFIAQWDGLGLSYPATGKNMYDIQDENGIYIVRELIKNAKNGGGFLEYTMPSLENEQNSLKLSYTQGIPEWEWYVGAGVYIDDIHKEIVKLKEDMKKELIETSIVTLVISLFIMILFMWIYSRLGKKIKTDFVIFVEFLNSVLKSNKKIDRNKLKIEEFDLMAEHANFMLDNKIKLEKNLKLYKHIVNTSGDFLSMVDRNYVYLAVNETYLKFFRKNREDIENKTANNLFGEEMFQKTIKPLHDRALVGESFIEDVWYNKDGKDRCLQTSFFPYYQAQEKLPFGFVISAKDITQIKIIEEKLKLWAKVFQNTSEAVLICDAQKHIITVNTAFSQITGYKEEDVVNKPVKIMQNDTEGDFFNEIFEIVSKENFWSGEVENLKKTGTSYPAHLNVNVVRDENSVITNYIIVFNDITKSKDSEKMLSFLAHHDVLTKLPNRTLLIDRITHAIENSSRLKNKIAICFIDLDNFKKINDSYGHSYGDEVLIQVASRIKSAIRKADTLSRIGGDEFVLLLENINDKTEIKNAIFKIQTLLKDTFIVNKQKFFISASIGISLYPDDGMDKEMLIKNADIAMYSAKDAGKNAYRFFTKDMSLASYETVNIESQLKDAIIKKEFIVYYQPQINLKTKEVIGLEALIRWNHPQYGIFAPSKFIKYAEETRMIIEIGEFVLYQACSDVVKLQKENNFLGRVSINVSGVQIEHSDFLTTLNKVIKMTKIDPNTIELEVTESTIMNEPNMWINLLSSMQESGVKIAIDDFGTGYSSLSYLQKLPIDKLKIDMSFVRNIPQDENACSIVNSIINLSDGMKMISIAEGIETKKQEDFLEKNGCHEGQGYLYGRPMPIKDLLIWLDTFEQEK